MRTRPLAVILLSGGLDSCVTAAVARRDYDLALCTPITGSARWPGSSPRFGPKRPTSGWT